MNHTETEVYLVLWRKIVTDDTRSFLCNWRLERFSPLLRSYSHPRGSWAARQSQPLSQDFIHHRNISRSNPLLVYKKEGKHHKQCAPPPFCLLDRKLVPSRKSLAEIVKSVSSEIRELKKDLENIALVNAAEDGHVDMLWLLLESGTSPNVAVHERELLHEVAGRPEYCLAPKLNEFGLKALLAFGANVNVLDTLGNTSLHLAAGNGKIKILEILLNYDAKVNIRNKNGDTPLLFALESGSVSTVRLLLSKGADAMITNRNGSTALHSGVDMCVRKWTEESDESEDEDEEDEGEELEMIRLLIEHNSELCTVKTLGEMDYTPLGIAMLGETELQPKAVWKFEELKQALQQKKEAV